VKRGEIRNAFDTIAEHLRQGAQAFKRQVGYRGGYEEETIYWHSRHGFWCLFDPEIAKTHYWCCFGTMDPADVRMVSITCQTNSPFEGTDRRTGGVFVRDDSGRVYLAHSGKIGGGRPGIGKQAFREFYGQKGVETVEWPDGRKSSVIVIGRIDGKYLLADVVGFVRQVQHFKALATRGRLATRREQLRHDFSPEFEGSRRSYTPSGEVEARCDHGAVVNRLYDELTSAGHKAANSRPDLYILKRGNVTHLFEVKTDTSTTSLYQGIGQLMLHGAAMNPIPKRILMLPDHPKETTRKALRCLGIAVLVFEWDAGQAIFPGLGDIVEALK
jgi:hypothetical protein